MVTTKKTWKSFVCIFSAAALSFSTIAYASQVTITPLDAAHASSEGESSGAVVSSQGPGTSQDAVSQEGPSGGAAQNSGVSAFCNRQAVAGSNQNAIRLLDFFRNFLIKFYLHSLFFECRTL